VLQLAVLTVLTGPGVVLLGPVTAAQAASSQTVKPDVLQTAWFWQTAIQQANPPVAPPAAPPTEPSGVPDGDVAVANTASDGSSSKQTALAFQVGALKAGATVTKFTLSLDIDASGTNVNADEAPIVACLPTRLWPAKAGASYTDAPPTDCATKATPKVDGDTYTFEISGIAQQWVGEANVGVALINDPDNTSTPFQAVFSVKSIKAEMTYTPPIAPPPVDTGNTGQLGGVGAGTGNGAGTGSVSTGSTAATPPAPVTLPPTGPTTTTTPDAGQQPQVAGTTPSTAPAALAKPASSSPNTAFWLAAIAIALIVVVAGVVLADDAVPVPTATTTRLGRVLRERERLRQASVEAATPDTNPTLTPRRV
jgi:hypothetical protein